MTAKAPDRPPLLADPIQHLLTLLDTEKPRIMIGLVGIPGSGKSTLALRLAEQMNAQVGPATMLALSMDGFHMTKAELRQFPDPEAAFARRGAPWTFDAQAFAKRLQDLRQAVGQRTVGWPDFQHELGDPVEDAHMVSATTRLVMVEGLYLLHGEHGWQGVQALFDEVWFLDTPLEVSMERLARRHMQAWDFTRAQAEHRIAQNDSLNAQMVLASAGLASWRI